MDYPKIAPMMGLLWAPLAAVTTSWRGKDNAQICLSIAGASIVPERPRVVVQLYKTNLTHSLAWDSRAFALCFLRKDQLELMRRLGFVSGRDREKLASLRYDRRETGSPVLLDSWGYLDCRVVNAMDGGDMTAFLAEVVDGGLLTQGEPLYWHYARTVVPKEWLDEYARKMDGEVAASRRAMGHLRHNIWPAML